MSVIEQNLNPSMFFSKWILELINELIASSFPRLKDHLPILINTNFSQIMFAYQVSNFFTDMIAIKITEVDKQKTNVIVGTIL